jgi:hypothetical protein
MTTLHLNSAKKKISQVFQTRLAGLDNDQMIHAIILLKTVPGSDARGQPRGYRQALTAYTGKSIEKHLPEIDTVLSRYGGRRLADHTSVLGSVPVATTRSGIYALAELPHVKAIIEKQSVSTLT